jgi:hypothetical protein
MEMKLICLDFFLVGGGPCKRLFKAQAGSNDSVGCASPQRPRWGECLVMVASSCALIVPGSVQERWQTWSFWNVTCPQHKCSLSKGGHKQDVIYYLLQEIIFLLKYPGQEVYFMDKRSSRLICIGHFSKCSYWIVVSHSGLHLCLSYIFPHLQMFCLCDWMKWNIDNVRHKIPFQMLRLIVLKKYPEQLLLAM